MKKGLRSLLITTVLLLMTFSAGRAQQVWPGDVNNNGIVNNVDILYWAVAKDATGAPRLLRLTDWLGLDLPLLLWELVFPNGLNYAYADCDGDGDVDEDDKDVIEKNFGRVHGTVTPDQYPVGSSVSDPVLLLTTENPIVPPAGTLLADLSLGSADRPVTDFYGIVFTVIYDPAVVGDGDDDFLLDVLQDSWINGTGGDTVTQFINNDRANGRAQVAMVRKDKEPVSGYGDLGTFSIVMEDIVVGLTGATVTDVKAVDHKLRDIPIATSELTFRVEEPLAAPNPPPRRQGVRLYPNPATDQWITLELDNTAEKIRLIQVFDAQGRMLTQLDAGGKVAKKQLPLGPYTPGLYILKIYTDQGLYVQNFFR